MEPQTNTHISFETKNLFKHLIIFIVVSFVLRFWNMVLFVEFPWSQFIIVPWIVILSIHLLLFFMSTGIIGDNYENTPVKQIAKDLLQVIKDRNLKFRKNIQSPIPPKDTPVQSN